MFWVCSNGSFGILRKKLTRKINFKGKSSLFELVKTKKAFVFITSEMEKQLVEICAAEHGIDIIQGGLGKIKRKISICVVGFIKNLKFHLQANCLQIISWPVIVEYLD